MLYVSSAVLKTWHPPLIGAAGSLATWTSVTVHDVQITNTLEGAAWKPDPAQVHMCQRCGEYGCYDGGYVHITRLGKHLLWTAPYRDEGMSELDVDIAANAIYEYAAVAVPLEVWDGWRRIVPSLPAAHSFPPATRRDLAAAWRMEAPPGLREQPLMEMLTRTAHRLLASDSLEYEQALEQLHLLVDWFLEGHDQPLTGELLPLASANARLETLHFDGSAGQDWRALAWGQARWQPALGKDWLYSAA